MTAIKLKTINFESSEIKDHSKEFNIDSKLEVTSPKTIAYAVRWQLARKRSGSAKVKSMSEISGTTAKPYKQKGTGNARQGSKRSVQFVGGRTCHGPTPRSFDFTLPKKISKKALKETIMMKIANDGFVIFSDESIKNIKTSVISKSLKSNKIDSALIICDLDDEKNKNLILSARNIKNTKVLDSKAVNPYDLLKYEKVITDEKTFEDKIIKSL